MQYNECRTAAATLHRLALAAEAHCRRILEVKQAAKQQLPDDLCTVAGTFRTLWLRTWVLLTTKGQYPHMSIGEIESMNSNASNASR